MFYFIRMVICNSSSDTCMLKTLLERRLTNLHQHAKRMKAKYYPDWENIMKEGAVQYQLETTEKICNSPPNDTIKSKDESDDEEESDNFEDDSDDTQSGTDTPEKVFMIEKEPKGVGAQSSENVPKKVESIKENPKKDSHSLANNKFLKQVAIAEQNVKKLLRSPQHKQASHVTPPPAHTHSPAKRLAFY